MLWLCLNLWLRILSLASPNNLLPKIVFKRCHSLATWSKLWLNEMTVHSNSATKCGMLWNNESVPHSQFVEINKYSMKIIELCAILEGSFIPIKTPAREKINQTHQPNKFAIKSIMTHLMEDFLHWFARRDQGRWKLFARGKLYHLRYQIDLRRTFLLFYHLYFYFDMTVNYV